MKTAVEWLADEIIMLEERLRQEEINLNDFMDLKDDLVTKALKIEKEQKGYSTEEVLEVFEHFKMDLPFHYEFLLKEHLQQLKQQEQ
jgi:hypothetical protein